jgi:hypothetical protein
MTHQRIVSPKFFTDQINSMVSRGYGMDNFTVQATNTGNHFVGIESGGGVVQELFDMNPQKRVTFETGTNSTTKADHVLLNLDFGTAIPLSYVAILNHNMKTADSQFFVCANTSAITLDNTGAKISSTEVINADDSSDVFTPDNDGDSIIKFDANQNFQHFGIQIEGTSSEFSSTDLKIGQIVIGMAFELTASPDLQVNRIIEYGNDIMETPSGKRFSSARFLEGFTSSDTTAGQPFRSKGTNTSLRFGGRTRYDISYSFVDDTQLTSSDISTNNHSSFDFYNSVWNKTNGSHIPFIFTPDSSSTTVGDYLYARFGQNELQSTQVASRVFNTSLSIVEEF